MKTVLIIDDDHELCDLLSNYLSQEGFDCSCAFDGHGGLEILIGQAAVPDLVILDVMLPKKNGLEVLGAIRASNRHLPVIMLSAKGEPVDRVVGLEMGADDYLPKPFEPRELLARMRALLRRSAVGPYRHDVGRLTVDGLVLDENSLQASFPDRAINLTPVEFKVLWLLASNAGRNVSRKVLFAQALGRREQVFDRSLDMHVSRIRKKVWPGDEGARRIRNIRGEGYRYSFSGPTPDEAEGEGGRESRRASVQK
ncbi:MAG: response regulator transcription factor [Deltaproteobacteria bacterium]|jgi:two-component system response regulator CpxR|nr:response regulator transcription factor [Deltaproteobacteria bacterium]